MTNITFKFIVYPYFKKNLEERKVKWNIFRIFSLNFTFRQYDCLQSDFARSNSSKVVFLEISEERR